MELHLSQWASMNANTDLHHLHAGLDVVAVGVVHQVGEGHEGMVQRLPGGDAALLVHG